MLNFTLLYIYCLKVNSSHTRMSGPPPHGHYPPTGQHQPPPPGQYYPQVSGKIATWYKHKSTKFEIMKKYLLLCLKSIKLNDCFKMNTRGKLALLVACKQVLRVTRIRQGKGKKILPARL